MADRKAEDLLYAVAVDVDEGKIRTAAQSTNELAKATEKSAEAARKAHMNVNAYILQLQSLKAGGEQWNRVIQEMNSKNIVLVGTEERLVGVMNMKTGALARSREELSRTAATQQVYVSAIDRMTTAERTAMEERQRAAFSFNQYYGLLSQIVKLEHTTAEDRKTAIETFRKMTLAEQEAEVRLAEAHLKELKAQQDLNAEKSKSSKIQQEQIREAEKAVDAYYKQIRPAQELAVRLHNLQKAGVDTSQATKLYAKEIVNAIDTQKKFGEKIPPTVAALEAQARAFVNAEQKSVNWGDKIKNIAQHPLQSLKTGVVSLTEKIGPLGVALVGVGAAAAAAGVKMVRAASEFGESAEHIERLAESIGVTTDQLQALQQVGELRGLGDLSGRLSFLQMQLGRGGGGPFVDMLHSLNIETERLSKQTGQIESIPILDLLRSFSKELQRIQDPIKRYETALAALGRYNKDWAFQLANADQQFFELMDTIGMYGGIIKKDVLENAVKLDDAFDRLKLIQKGFSDALKKSVTESLKPFAEALVEIWDKAVKLREEQEKAYKQKTSPWQQNYDTHLAESMQRHYSTGTVILPEALRKRFEAEAKAYAGAQVKAQQKAAQEAKSTATVKPTAAFDPELEMQVAKAHLQNLAAGRENLALHDALARARVNLTRLTEKATVENLKNSKSEVQAAARVVASLEERVKASDALYASMGDFNNKIKYQQQVLDAYAKSAGALPERVAKGQIGIYKQIMDDGQRLTEAQIKNLTQYANDSRAIIRNQAIPTFKEMVEKSKDQFGVIPESMHKAVYDMSVGAERDLREQFLPVWQKTSQYTTGMTVQMSEQILKQIEQMLSSPYADVREAASKTLLQWVNDTSDASKEITEQARTVVVSLMHSAIPESRKAGMAAYQAYLDGFMNATGLIPSSELETIVDQMRSLDPAMQNQGVSNFKKYRQGAMSELETLPDNWMTVLDTLILDSRLKLSNEGLASFSEYISNAVAAHKDLSRALPFIDRYLSDTDTRINQAARKWHSDYVQSITDASGRVADSILPQIMENMQSGNAVLLQVALEDWEKWKNGVVNTFGYIPEEGLPVIEYLLDSAIPELLQRGEADWELYARNSANAFNKIFEQFGRAETYQQFSNAIRRLAQQIEMDLRLFGNLPRGIPEEFGKILLQVPRDLQQEMMGTWAHIVDVSVDAYGDLPPQLERINQQLIVQQERLAVRLVARFADAFAQWVDDASLAFAEIMIEGGKLGEALGATFRTLGKSLYKTIFDALFSPIKELFRQLGSMIGQMMKQQISGVTDALGGLLKKVFPKLSNPQQHPTVTPEQQALLDAAMQIDKSGVQLEMSAKKMAADFNMQIQAPMSSMSAASNTLASAGGMLTTAAGALQEAAAALIASAGGGAGSNLLSKLIPSKGEFGNMLPEFMGDSWIDDVISPDDPIWDAIRKHQGGIPSSSGSDTSAPTIDWGAAAKGLAGTAGTMLLLDSFRHKGARAGIEGGIGGAAAGWGMAPAGYGLQGAGIGGGLGLLTAGMKTSGAGGWAMGIGGAAMMGAALGSIIPGIGTAIGAAVGATVGAIMKGVQALMGKSTEQAGAMEAARDFGGVKISKDYFKQFYESKGLNEDSAWGIRKDLLSSPEMLKYLGEQAQTQGKMDDFLKSLERVETSWGTFNFRDAYEIGQLTDNWKMLDEVFIDAFEHSDRLQKKLPDWRAQLTLTGDALKETAGAFEDLFLQWMKTGEYSEEFSYFLKENAEALDEAAKKSKIFADQLELAREAQKAFLELSTVIRGFSDIKSVIETTYPYAATMYDLFINTGKITKELADEIVKYGGDLAAFETYSGIVQLNNYFGEVVEHFRETGEILPDLRSMIADFGGDLSALDAAAELPNLMGFMDGTYSFADGLYDLLPELSGLQEVLSGNWGEDVISKLIGAGLDPSKFQQIAALIKIEREWENEIQRFMSGGRMVKNGAIETALRLYGGEQGRYALDLYGKGQNIVTPDMLAGVKSSVDDAYRTEREKVLTYLQSIEETTSQKITDLQNGVEEQITLAGNELSQVMLEAKDAIVNVLELILKAINEEVIDRASTTVSSGNRYASSSRTSGTTQPPPGTQTELPGTTPQQTYEEYEALMQQMLYSGFYPWQIEEWARQNPYPMYERGGYVPRTELALVHEGEYVVPSNTVQDLGGVTTLQNTLTAASGVNTTNPGYLASVDTKEYYDMHGNPFNPLEDYGWYYRDAEGYWWSHALQKTGSSGVRLDPNHLYYDWMQHPGPGAVGVMDSQDMIFRRKHPSQEVRLLQNGLPIIKQTVPASMSYDEMVEKYYKMYDTGIPLIGGSRPTVWEMVTNPSTGKYWTKEEILRDSGLTEAQYDSYMRYSQKMQMNRLYALPEYVGAGFVQITNLPKPDYTKTGYYYDGQLVGDLSGAVYRYVPWDDPNELEDRIARVGSYSAAVTAYGGKSPEEVVKNVNNGVIPAGSPSSYYNSSQSSGRWPWYLHELVPNSGTAGSGDITRAIPRASGENIGRGTDSDAVSRTVVNSGVRKYENGGYVPNDLLALLHKGEYVLSRDMISQLTQSDYHSRPLETDEGLQPYHVEPDRPLQIDRPSENGNFSVPQPKWEFKVEVHCEGATFYGPQDMVKQVASAFTEWWDRGGFPMLRNNRK